ncbi:carbohydrate ABC transporter permease [Spirochaeta dissipatitropha]
MSSFNVKQTNYPSKSSLYSKKNKEALQKALLIIVTVTVLLVFLMPLFYGFSMSLKSRAQIAALNPSPLPRSPMMYEYAGRSYEVLLLPMDDGTFEPHAIISKGRSESEFLDFSSETYQIKTWEGQWRQLEQVWELDPQWVNFPTAWKAIDFLKLLQNTLFYAIVTTLGTVISSTLVAYGFSRFSFKFKKLLFSVLISTIILPAAVMLIPQYVIFYQLGWVGTWLPLIVPHFFANAYNVFLLRQFLNGIPKEMDEAARIDGAGPVQTLTRVILPQLVPVMIAVGLFHFFFAWNDFFGPLIYLSGKPDLQPISVGLASFNNMYTSERHLIQAASIISTALPLTVFFFAQKFFMQGVVVTGVDK